MIKYRLKNAYVLLYAEYYSYLALTVARVRRIIPNFVRSKTLVGASRSRLNIIKRAIFLILRIIVLLLIPLWSLRAFMHKRSDQKISVRQFGESTLFRRFISFKPACIVIFAPIDYEFRFQRPQQLAKILVHLGYQVIFVNPTINISNNSRNYTQLTKVDNIKVVNIYLKDNSSYVSINPISKSSAQIIAILLEDLFTKENVGNTTLVFQQPGWFNLAQLMAGNQIVFDCMDLHHGFENISAEMEILDAELAVLSDLVTVTSPFLQKYLGQISGQESNLIRNGCDFAFFNNPKDRIEMAIVVGYFGAIAEWFDVSFVRELALSRADITIELIGSVTTDKLREIRHLPNVKILGEVPYRDLPEKIAKWRIGIIPFKLTPLIQATNAVKMYEYASAGLQVLSTRIPEVELAASQTQGIYVVDSNQEILSNLEIALSQPSNVIESLQSWASNQSWLDRGVDLVYLINKQTRVSVVILMWNKADMTIRCLKSIIERSGYQNLEIILVDNASELNEYEIVQNWIILNGAPIRVIRNNSNLGFAAGNNVGIREATGEYVVLLNNDTEVTSGWIWKALKHFRRTPGLGLLGPSTNNCGNEARVRLRSPEEDWLDECFFRFNLRTSETIEATSVAFFCVFIPRKVILEVGLLDEGFGRGYFEDDDYCRRVETFGYEIKIARDIFIYHKMGASFNTIGELEQNELFLQNKRRYESKWGKWHPHVYSTDSDQ